MFFYYYTYVFTTIILNYAGFLDKLSSLNYLICYKVLFRF